MKQRTLAVRPTIAAVAATQIVAITALLLAPWWAAGTITGLALVLLSVTVHHHAAPWWALAAARWRRARRRPAATPAAVDVTVGDIVCGVRIHQYEAVAAIKLAGRPHRPTFLRGPAAHTDDTIPLHILADMLTQPGGIHLSIDIVSEGRRVRRSSGYPALYSTLLANRPAAGQRATHLVIHLDIPASSTGLGYRESVGAALAAATERITSALKQAGVRATVMTATELDSHIDTPTGAALRWSSVKTHDGYASTYLFSPEDINTAAWTRMWALHVEAITLTITLTNIAGTLNAAATARVVTAQPPAQPPTLDLNPLPGETAHRSARTRPARLALPCRNLDDPDELLLPVGPCGVLIGAAAHHDHTAGVLAGDFVTLPLTDPAATTRIAMDVPAGYARAVLARAAAVGERIIIHTNRPDEWAGLVDPNIAVAREGRAKFVPTIIVNDHALAAPPPGLATTMITLGAAIDADITFTGDETAIQVTTASTSIEVEPITFLREQTWTG